MEPPQGQPLLAVYSILVWSPRRGQPLLAVYSILVWSPRRGHEGVREPGRVDGSRNAPENGSADHHIKGGGVYEVSADWSRRPRIGAGHGDHERDDDVTADRPPDQPRPGACHPACPGPNGSQA